MICAVCAKKTTRVAWQKWGKKSLCRDCYDRGYRLTVIKSKSGLRCRAAVTKEAETDPGG